MKVEIFEKALAAKLLKELDYPENWTNESLTSIKHKIKDHYILIHVSSNQVTLIAPQKYTFVSKKLSEELFKKAYSIFQNAEAITKVKKEEEARQKLIEEFGLEDRATKLKTLAEISKNMPEPIPVVKGETIETNFKLPEKKKKFWGWNF